MKKVAKNNYKGFIYEIIMTESGWLYEVFEMGLITGKPRIVLYGGRHGEEYTKVEMENMIDEYLKKENIRPKSTCPYYQDSYAKGGCFFSNSNCCDDECLFSNSEKYWQDKYEEESSDWKDENEKLKSFLEENGYNIDII